MALLAIRFTMRFTKYQCEHYSPAMRQDPILRTFRLPDDVRHYHSGPYYWRFCRTGKIQGVPDFYYPLDIIRLLPVCAYGLEPQGVMAKWGVVDFAGGIVVHATAGFAALASTLYVGRRVIQPDGSHNIPYIALGAGLLWFGWYGFNAGSELQVNTITVSAFVTTDIAAAFAGATWLLIEKMHTGKPKFVGFLTGAVAGLATITPAAGMFQFNQPH
jgi:hypothetical protein